MDGPTLLRRVKSRNTGTVVMMSGNNEVTAADDRLSVFC